MGNATIIRALIRAQSLGLSKTCPNIESPERVNLDEIRNKAARSIQKAALADSERFNRGRAQVKSFSKGDYVFIKCSERNQTKLSRKFRGPFLITKVLENDRYELRAIAGGNRVFKYSHENLRLVPKGFEGLVEVATSLIDNEEAETAVSREQVDLDDSDSDTLSVSGVHTMTAGSDTLSGSDDEERLVIPSKERCTTGREYQASHRFVRPLGGYHPPVLAMNRQGYAEGSSSCLDYRSTNTPKKPKQSNQQFREKNTEKVEVWVCKICEKDFASKSSLYRHFSTVHEIPHPAIGEAPKSPNYRAIEKNDEYDTDSTVLLTDFKENPEKVSVKRRKLNENYNSHRRRTSHGTSEENNAEHSSRSRVNGELETTHAPENCNNEVCKQRHVSYLFTQKELERNVDDLENHQNNPIKDSSLTVEIDSDDDDVITIGDSDDDYVEIEQKHDTSTNDKSHGVSGPIMIGKNGRGATIQALESGTVLNINDSWSSSNEKESDTRIKVLKQVIIRIPQSTEVTDGNVLQSPNINSEKLMTDALNKPDTNEPVTDNTHVDFNLKASSENNSIEKNNFTKALKNDGLSTTSNNNDFQEIATLNFDNIPIEVNNTHRKQTDNSFKVNSRNSLEKSSKRKIGNQKSPSRIKSYECVKHNKSDGKALSKKRIRSDCLPTDSKRHKTNSVEQNENVKVVENRVKDLRREAVSYRAGKQEPVPIRAEGLIATSWHSNETVEREDVINRASKQVSVTNNELSNPEKGGKEMPTDLKAGENRAENLVALCWHSNDTVEREGVSNHVGKQVSNTDNELIKREKDNIKKPTGFKVIENRAEILIRLSLPSDRTVEREGTSNRTGKQVAITIDDRNKCETANKKKPTSNNCQNENDLLPASKRSKINSKEHNEYFTVIESRTEDLIELDSPPDETIDRQGVGNHAGNQVPITNNKLNKRKKRGKKKSTGLKFTENQAGNLIALSWPSNDTVERECVINRTGTQTLITNEDLNTYKKANTMKRTDNDCQKDKNSGLASRYAESLSRTKTTDNNRVLNHKDNLADKAINNSMITENETTALVNKATDKNYVENNKCSKPQRKGNEEKNKLHTEKNTNEAQPDCSEPMEIQSRVQVDDKEDDGAATNGPNNASDTITNASAINSIANYFTVLKKSSNYPYCISQGLETLNEKSKPKEDSTIVEAQKNNLVKVEKEYTCSVCSCVFNCRDVLLSHLKNNHSLVTIKLPNCKAIKCAFCSVTYRRENYNSHVRMYHTDSYFKKVESSHNGGGSLNSKYEESLAKIEKLITLLQEDKNIFERSRQNNEEKIVTVKQSSNSDSAKKTVPLNSKDETLNKVREHSDKAEEQKSKNIEQNLQSKNRKETIYNQEQNQCYPGEEIEVNSNHYRHDKSIVRSNEIEKLFEPLTKKIHQQSGEKNNEHSRYSYTENRALTKRHNEQKTTVAVKSRSYKFECKLCKEVVYSDYMSRKHKKDKHPHIKNRIKMFNKTLLSNENERREVKQMDRVSDNEENYDSSSDAVSNESSASSDNESNAEDQNRDRKTGPHDNHLNNTKYRYKYKCNLCEKVMNSHYMTLKHKRDKHPEVTNLQFNKLLVAYNKNKEIEVDENTMNENKASNDESDDEIVRGGATSSEDKSDVEDENNMGYTEKTAITTEESTAHSENNAIANNKFRVPRSHKYNV